MAHKSKRKKNNNRGETWCNYYPRRTKTKKEKLKSIEKKYKKDLTNE